MSVKGLFDQLNEWKNSQALKKDPKACDNLAIICLRIISILLNSNKESRIIAKHLSLVPQSYREEDVSEDLSFRMAIADGQLETNLRGFSRLLKWVLTEHCLSRNPSVLLQQVKGVGRGIIKSFDTLSLMLKAYFDFSLSFSLRAEKAITMMFLHTMATIYDEAFRPNVGKGSSIILQWLKDRVKNDELLKLYREWQTMEDLEEFYPKELLVLAICYKSAKGEAIRADEINRFDRSLIRCRMLGLKSLVDSGFLSLEGPALRAKKGSKKFKVLRGFHFVPGKLNGQSTK